ncbi:MAG: mannose-6-phosphate isomerase, class I [Candidatus Marinimicrobia bacterium]|nr:mannose-6-phosphate isomerase, class I [Candidatus Neomarinimicrobiota bacterium]
MHQSEQMDCQTHRPYRLKNVVQHYGWGNRNDQAFIAHLLGVTPEKDQPFAELWMGIHPNAASAVIDPNEGISPLPEWLLEKPGERLSQDCLDHFPTGLPYLFKVLSAGQALSIQAHPNQQQAEILHKIDPDHYPDDNHKPEIAIAIDHLDALIGFVTTETFLYVLKSTPELQSLLFKNELEQPTLQSAILRLLKLGQDQSPELASSISEIESRLTLKTVLTEAETLFLSLTSQHGNLDIGLLFLFFLNRVYLGPGDAVFLPPGIPHAYLKGNIIECMANSDNVVRLGLTDKFCDVKALSQILVFNDDSDFRVKTLSDGYLKEYLTPTSEFRVKSLDLLQGESRVFSFRSELTLFLVLDGEVSLRWGAGKSTCICVYRRGDSFITPAKLIEFSIQAKNHCKLYLVDIPKNPSPPL